MDNVIQQISELIKGVKCANCAFWTASGTYDVDDGSCSHTAFTTDSGFDCNVYTRANFYCKEFIENVG